MQNQIESVEPEYWEILRKDVITSEEAEDLLEQVLYYTPSKEKIHVILDKLSGYMLENPIHLTVELDEDAEGKEDIFVPLKNYYHEYEDAKTDEYDQYEFDDNVSVKIFNALRKEKNRFGNYLVQLHIKEILDAPYQHQIADEYEEDAEEILVPKNENWFCDVDNEYMQYLLKKDFGVDIQGYSPNIRKNFFDFLNSRSVENISKLKKFILAYGNNGLKSFLVLEIDGNIGEDILKIGRCFAEYRELDGKIMFRKLAEIVDLANQESEVLNKSLGIKNEQLSVRNQLLEKVRTIIVNFSKVFKMSVIGQYNKKEKQQLVETLLSDLEKSKTEIILLAAALKSGAELEQLKDWGVEEKEDLNELEKEEMVAITERNWDQIKNIKSAVVQGFKESLEGGKNRKWYIAKFKDKIASFLGFTPTQRGTLYAGSFNVDPDARGLGIGDEMMERALRKESEEHVLEATVSPRIPAGTAYVERTGFVIDGFIADYHQTGEPLFTIRLDNEQNKSYVYRNEGKQESIDEEHLKKQCWTHEDIMPLIGKESFVLKFDVKDDSDFERMKETMRKLLVSKKDDLEIAEGVDTESKYVITRYFRGKKEKNSPAGEEVRYFVFEKATQ